MIVEILVNFRCEHRLYIDDTINYNGSNDDNNNRVNIKNLAGPAPRRKIMIKLIIILLLLLLLFNNEQR